MQRAWILDICVLGQYGQGLETPGGVGFYGFPLFFLCDGNMGIFTIMKLDIRLLRERENLSRETNF